MHAVYDEIGQGYAQQRREDPTVRTAILRALGDARSVINVGAGTGSYEPLDRYVVAVEPSDVMAAQRPADRVPAIRGSAAGLPYRDDAFDAAMTVLSLHHWGPDQERGVRELRRVASGPVIVVTLDPAVSGQLWIFRDYFPSIAEHDRATFPVPDRLVEWLGPDTEITEIPLGATTPDGMLLSFWAHPERVLDPIARAATSGFARLPLDETTAGLTALADDLASGAWDAAHGHLRGLDTLDVGLRLLVATAGPRSAASQ